MVEEIENGLKNGSLLRVGEEFGDEKVEIIDLDFIFVIRLMVQCRERVKNRFHLMKLLHMVDLIEKLE